MDPISILIILLIIAASGTAGTSIAQLRSRIRQGHLHHAVSQKLYIHGQLVSIFDIFWDLGANDFALEVMAHQGIVPATSDELPQTQQRLQDLLSDYGTYSEYISDTLKTIEEFYKDHQRLGSRRQLPSLEVTTQKLLPILPNPTDGHTSPPFTPHPLDSVILSIPQAGRQHLREHIALQTNILDSQSQSAPMINLDDLSNIDPTKLLESLFAGNIANDIQRWWRQRKLRQLKQELDQQLSAFYTFYADIVHRTPNFYQHLYDTHYRWSAEIKRLEWLQSRRPWKHRPWVNTADALLLHAITIAQNLAQQAYRNVHDTIELIHDHALKGNKAMAGYLIYLNRHAFFAGRDTRYGDYVRNIEYATYHIQEEIRRLHKSGIL